MLKTITSFVDSLGSLTYKGLWNAATNTPTLASGVGTTGDYYVVSVPGTTTLDGISSWAAGDWAIFNGSVWEKYNNPADTLGEVLANGNTTAGTDISVTTGDDITFADNSKAIFGAGSDLQIYHDGSGSYIDDQGTGPIRIRSGVGGALRFQDLDGDDLINATSNGAVTLYYDNSAKLATTSTGIDVTGSVTADGLTAGNTSAAYSAVYIISSATGESELRMGDTDTDAGSIAYTNSDDTMTFRAAAGARMTLDSTGIDVTGSVTADGLTVDGTSSSLVASIENDSTAAGSGGLKVNIASTASNSVPFYVRSDDKNRFRVLGNGDISFYSSDGLSQALFWDASAESLGIGTSSPSAPLHIVASTVAEMRYGAIGPSNNSALRISRNDSTTASGNPLGYLEFGGNDATGAVDTSFAYVGAEASGTHAAGDNPTDLVFGTTADGSATVTERMRIDSSGNLLVGTTNANPTSPSVNDAGVELSDTGGVRSTVAENPAATFNRKTDDGAIALFRKDGSTVGSIGSYSGSYLQIGTGNSGIAFNVANSIRPVDMAGAQRDGGIDLGHSSARFKDLYLSGGVVFGTTGGSVSSKTLDDYEEGTWTPVIADAATGGNVGSATTAEGFYTKVGQVVNVYMFVSNIVTTGMTAAAAIYV